MANSLWCVNHVHSAFMNSETVDSISSDIKYHVYEERHFRSEYIHEKQKETLQDKMPSHHPSADILHQIY